MPRGDGTGPMGMGPMTGRGAGVCADFDAPVYGCGYGRGRGRGNRQMFCTGVRNKNIAYASDTDQRELLENQVSLLENRLHEIKKRLASFEGGTEE
ncbi:MAG: DUF5320 domain-containing protein [Eubacteriales bacterium]|nr:DUF5320 domain-containing protein [Eubacteriales bacterium]